MTEKRFNLLQSTGFVSRDQIERVTAGHGRDEISVNSMEPAHKKQCIGQISGRQEAVL